MLEYITIGIILGVSAGFSPGPLTALIISETLMYGLKAGLRVCFAPLFTDIVIVPLTIFFLSHLQDSPAIAIISFLGAFYIFNLGYDNLTFKGEIKLNLQQTRSLQKGIITNFLSPNPYIFWITIGGPLFLKANEATGYGGYLFLVTFYVVMISIKILISVLTAKSREFIKGKAFIYIIRFTGALMIALSILLIKIGIQNLGAIRCPL